MTIIDQYSQATLHPGTDSYWLTAAGVTGGITMISLSQAAVLRPPRRPS